MHTNSLISIITALSFCGCSTLDAWTEYGDKCGTAESPAYVFLNLDGNDDSACKLGDESCKEYETALRMQRCPAAFPKCSTDLNGKAFCHESGRCPVNMHEINALCEKDAVFYCGNSGKSCSTDNILYSAQVECQNGECIATQCIDGYHIYKNQCEQDSTDNCGEHDNRCQVPANGAAICNAGKCGIQCNKGYTLCSNSCVDLKTNINHCGNCESVCSTDNVSNSAAVTCADSICKADSCNSGYKLYNNVCVVCIPNETVCTDASHAKQCKTDGSGYNTPDVCPSPTNGSGVCRSNHCSFDCNTGYHSSSIGNQCNADSVTACGSDTNNCTELPRWEDGTCDKGVCNMATCSFGYVKYTHDGGSDCIEYRAKIIDNYNNYQDNFNNYHYYCKTDFEFDYCNNLHSCSAEEIYKNKCTINYSQINYKLNEH